MDPLASGINVGERLEYPFGNLAQILFCKFAQQFVGMLRQGGSQAALVPVLVIREPQAPRLAALIGHFLPVSQQGMLQHRQLIRLVAAIVEETEDQRAFYVVPNFFAGSSIAFCRPLRLI